MTFPISRKSDRSFASDWRGEVVICDIDRTYLATRLSSLKGMASIPFEFAVDKQAISGMTTLLKELRRGPGSESRQTPLYFISASPAQLRSVIERKMLLDGLEFDGTTFKDWVGVILGGRLARFREQLGFKLTALLSSRLDLPAGAIERLLGDDLETDAQTYMLYADLLAERLSEARLERVLVRFQVASSDREAIAQLTRRVKDHVRGRGGVARAYLRLEKTNDPQRFSAYAPHLVVGRTAFQLACALFADGCISESAVLRVAADVRTRDALDEQVVDAVQRGLVDQRRAMALARQLVDQGRCSPQVSDALVGIEQAVATREGPWTPSDLLD